MTSVIAALSFGGEWSIANPESIKTSFPDFLKKINELKKQEPNSEKCLLFRFFRVAPNFMCHNHSFATENVD